MTRCLFLFCALLCAGPNAELHAAGRQLTGQYAPAATPALPPAEAEKKFTVPDGFEVRIFAAEPDVVNPVAMTWDERGRLWVVELYEYPLGAAPGTKPRDCVKVLEDTDGDGRADKVTVFADGLNLATGILIGNGGVYVGQAPHLLFFEDTNGDDIADKKTIAMTGFGLEDRHELLNGFAWGPDGYLYMTHGVFTYSKVKDPNDPDDDGVVMTAAVARFHPKSKKFEVFAEGTSNPWGVDFDAAGNAFVSACVIDHLFHMAPGGLYTRQAGVPPHPYAYELLPAIVDHKHFRAAYAGVQIYQGHQYPPEYQGTIFMGNIHDNSVHQDRLTPNGSTFKASFVRDFLRANDGWFRPVSTQTGPDGALWIMDWYDKYPCYQNANADPEGVDRAHGRIWRVVYTGKTPGAPVAPHLKHDLRKAPNDELISTLSHPNVWHRRVAQRLLSERRDASIKQPLQQLLRNAAASDTRLAALWTLHTAGLLDEALLDSLTRDGNPAIRAWVARLTGERAHASAAAIDRLEILANDPDPSVRSSVLTAVRQFASGSLTVNTPPPASAADAQFDQVLATVALHPGTPEDPVLPFMFWMAAEPGFVRDPEPGLAWLAEHAVELKSLAPALARKAMRRLCDTEQHQSLEAAIAFVQALPDNAVPVKIAALDGLIEGQRGKTLSPAASPAAFLNRLATDPNRAIAERARQLGTLWGDASALEATLRLIKNRQAAPTQRVEAVHAAKQQKTVAVRNSLLAVATTQEPEPVAEAAVRALADVGGETVAEELLTRWRGFNPSLRRAAADVLVSRRPWAQALLSAIETQRISAADVPVPNIRSLLQSKDDYVRNRAQQVIGRFRESQPDKLQLIREKKAVVLNGPVNIEAGREIARKTCFTCHKLHGEGAEVGPDLTGVGRSTLDALLAHVIDPNQLIGIGYENVEVETKDGRSISGRLVEETDTRVKLVSAGPKEEIIAKTDIASIRVSELSVMPEGLEQMPDADFRNLIWFILNPPEDKRPLTPELRKELTGQTQ